MIGLYLAVGIVGVGLILLAALGGVLGHHDMDNSSEAHMLDGHDGSADADHGDSHGFEKSFDKTLDKSIESVQAAGLWLPFFTIRFWTGFMAGFGALGTLATITRTSAEPTTLIASIVVGAVVGAISAYIYRALQLQQKDASTKVDDIVGVSGKLLVGAKGQDLGKVRLSVRGELIDILARSDNGQDLEAGEEVVVVSMDGRSASVVSTREILE